jgi:hypothetical protein
MSQSVGANNSQQVINAYRILDGSRHKRSARHDCLQLARGLADKRKPGAQDIEGRGQFPAGVVSIFRA